MNPVLRRIIETGKVLDGINEIPVFDNMETQDCRLITEAIKAVKPNVSLEVGFGCGISTLFACDAMMMNNKECKHIVIDPYQETIFRNIGLRNVQRAGCADIIDFHAAPSELALPRLLDRGTRIQTAIIDGMHTFDHALIDFFYINKMLDVGGVVILDDANFPSIARLTRHIRTYPAYELFWPFGFGSRSSIRTEIRHAISRILPSLKSLKPIWGHPRCVAFRKARPDRRDWKWHVNFGWAAATYATMGAAI